jgi:hypothetical protein
LRATTLPPLLYCDDTAYHASLLPALYLLGNWSGGVWRLFQLCSERAMKRATARGRVKERWRPTLMRTGGSQGLDGMLHLMHIPGSSRTTVRTCWLRSHAHMQPLVSCPAVIVHEKVRRKEEGEADNEEKGRDASRHILLLRIRRAHQEQTSWCRHMHDASSAHAHTRGDSHSDSTSGGYVVTAVAKVGAALLATFPGWFGSELANGSGLDHRGGSPVLARARRSRL